VRKALAPTPSAAVESMVQQAAEQTQKYEREAEESEKLGYLGGLEGAMKNQYKMNSIFRDEAEKLSMPQFCFVTEPDLFHAENYAKLNKETLSKGFSLKNADSNINFSLASGEIYALDATDSGVVRHKMTQRESEYIRTQMERLPDKDKRRLCVDLITSQLERKTIGDLIMRDDMRAYIERVIDNLSNDDLTALETSYQLYAMRIQQKIEELLSDYREESFKSWLETSDILCRPMFELPKIITPPDIFDGLEKSLYESEAAVNTTERTIIDAIAALSNVKWWHRIAERKPYSFSINGFINHYPDFLVMTNKGILVVVEVKGDDRDNSDSERKLRLGRKWAEKAGDGYRYYIVFDKLNWHKEGAYDLAEFLGIMGRL
jgi:type III restriction enzyme